MSIEALQNAVAILLQNPDRPFAVGDVVLKKRASAVSPNAHILAKRLSSATCLQPQYSTYRKGPAAFITSLIYDIRIAFFDRDGDLVELAEDSRRFRHADD
ncbi:hypothetical protein NMD97_07870 [Edwardsiella tarda]